MTKEKLLVVLEQHEVWLNNGCGAMGAHANLSGSSLSGSSLSGASLRGANLRSADLRDADLRSANLGVADLRSASLSGANLSGANLRSANLRSANLRGAHLNGANLSGADLRSANLSGADLSSTDLHGADLRDTDLSNALLPNFMLIPEVGPFYAFKKLSNGSIATLYIPRSAARTSSLVGRKCRASKVKVVALSSGDVGVSSHNPLVEYRVGCWVKADKFDSDIRVECTNGIHFFITKKEAEEY